MATKSLKRVLGSLSFLLLCTVHLFAADNVPASFDPPGGLDIDSCPVFIVLGFDDNRYVDGMEWTMNLLDQYKNPAGTGNSATFDGTSIKAAFYHTSGALDNATHGGDALLAIWKRAVDAGHEVADHTVTHNTSKSTTLAEWEKEIADSRKRLSDELGVPEDEIVGFRTPYLDFNEFTFQAIANQGLLYECTMTQMQDYNKGQFVWPYTLDEGFPDKTISGWKGKSKLPGLWELPVYTVGENAEMWPPITGFDSSVLTQANGSKYELMLKNALDYRLKEGGNRAPLTVGLHTDTYAEANPSGKNYDQALTLLERRAALKAFIEYALTKPEVRFVTGVQLIEWMRNPVPLGRDEVSIVTPKSVSATTVQIVDKSVRVTNLTGEAATVKLFSTSGRLLSSVSKSIHDGAVQIQFDGFAQGAYLLQVTNGTTTTSRSIVF